MKNIRYYGRRFEPELFEGWEGRIIRALNFLRWKLEIYVIFKVFKYLLKRAVDKRAKKKAFVKQFNSDKKEDFNVTQEEFAPESMEGKQFKRYNEGRGEEAPEIDATDLFFARLMAPMRQKNYQQGRSIFTLMEVDDKSDDAEFWGDFNANRENAGPTEKRVPQEDEVIDGEIEEDTR